jgi:NDP-sugar pyrophosphorylase family protein
MTIGVILAAGKGSRLVSVSEQPKPLKLIGGHTVLSHAMSRFAGLGLTRVYLVTRSHEDDYQLISKHYEQHIRANIEVVKLSSESYIDSPLNDLIQLALVAGFSSHQTLLVSYCDIVTTFSLASLITLHAMRSAEMSLLLFRGDRSTYVHEFRLSESGRVTVVPSPVRDANLFASAGIFMLESGFLAPYNRSTKIPFSFSDGPAVKASDRGSLYGCSTDDHYFEEIGTLKYFHACDSAVGKDSELRRQLFPFGS